MKIVFMGTPSFAVASLNMLIESFEVLAVVTQPDKPRGRGKKLTFSPVKEVALENNIEVLQPIKMKDEEFINKLKGYNADVFVVVAYGRILTEKILSIPRLGCINVHGSLLPKLRGAGPIQWSIINGYTKTGVTTMFMDVGLDTGDMLLKSEIAISPEDTYGTLGEKMAIVGADTLKETLYRLSSGTLKREKQNDDNSTYAPMLSKDDELIKWNSSALEINNLIRGLNPSPGAYSILDGVILKIWEARVSDKKYDSPSGSIVEITKKGFIVATGDFGLEILEITPKGGKKMTADAYLRGHKINILDRFTDNI